MNLAKKYESIEAYMADQSEPAKTALMQVLVTVQNAAPKAECTISYNIPTLKMGKALVHFAGYKNHIGFYPTPSAIEAFKEQLAGYKMAKGSVQFPLSQPLPLDLISKMTRFRADAETKRT